MTSDNLFSLDGEGQTFADLFTLWTERQKIDVVFSLEKDYLTKLMKFLLMGGLQLLQDNTKVK